MVSQLLAYQDAGMNYAIINFIADSQAQRERYMKQFIQEIKPRLIASRTITMKSFTFKKNRHFLTRLLPGYYCRPAFHLLEKRRIMTPQTNIETPAVSQMQVDIPPFLLHLPQHSPNHANR